MNVVTSFSGLQDSSLAVVELATDIRDRLPGLPHLILIYFTEQYAGQRLVAQLQAEFPTCQIMGCSSCQGVMTEMGYHSTDGWGLACWALHDPKGAYGAAMMPLTDQSVAAQVEQLLTVAMQRADRPGELPQLVWLHATPGCEEAVMHAIEDQLGHSVAIVGGSAAHNLQAGLCQLVTQDGMLHDGIAVVLFYPDCQVATAFHAAYMPTGQRGFVTRAEGRELLEIDHRPAADVYNEWTHGIIGPFEPGAKVLGQTTLFPLARQVGTLAGIPYYKLSHPECVTSRRGLRLFTQVNEGESLILMQVNRHILLDRTVRLTDFSFGQAEVEQIAALNVFCAGCMLTLSPVMDRILDSLQQARGGMPFIGLYAFGEQGRFRGGENAHANLMIATVVFFRNREWA